jgi:hypothetical protein
LSGFFLESIFIVCGIGYPLLASLYRVILY